MSAAVDQLPFAAGGETRIGFVLLPGFTLLSYISAVEALAAANRLSSAARIETCALSPDGRSVSASNGMRIEVDGQLEAGNDCQLVVLCAGYDQPVPTASRLNNWLHQLDRHGVRLGGFDAGAGVLASAGLLADHHCAVHWEHRALLAEQHPELHITSARYALDERRLTCSGGVASIDAMLDIIADHHGETLASAVAEQLLHERRQQRESLPQQATVQRLGVHNRKLVMAIELMEANLEEVLEKQEIARLVSVSTRHLERLFRKYLQTTPNRYYFGLRMGKARTLVTRTDLNLYEVATACGFVSQSHFSSCYRSEFGCTPREERRALSARHAQQLGRPCFQLSSNQALGSS